LAEGRDIFNGVLEDYLGHYLADNADIVHCVDFERGVCKVASGADCTLTAAERRAVAHLRKAPTVNDEEVEQEVETPEDKENITYYEELRLRKKRRCEPQEYIDVEIVQSTSCSIERIFSDSKYVLTDQRKNFEINYE
jgi:hypothetical protein